MIKKLFIIALIFFLVALGIGAYFIFVKPQSSLQVVGLTSNNATSTDSNAPFGAPGIVEGSNQNQQTASTSASVTIPGQTIAASVTGAPIQLFADMVAGLMLRATKTDEYVRFVERATGHIDEISLDTDAETTVSNTTAPKIYDATFLLSGSTALLRTLDDSETTIKSYSLTIVPPKTIKATKGIPASVTATTTTGVALSDNIISIAPNPSGTKAFYLTLTTNGVVGIIANPDGSKPSSIFTSPLSEWTAQWTTANMITLTTKPSGAANGYSYALNTAGGNPQKILGGILGLITNTDPTGTLVAYSDSVPTLHIYNIKTKDPMEHKDELLTLINKALISNHTSDTIPK